MTPEETKQLVEKITDFVNSYSLKSEQFNEAMSREHRTLQQSFTRLCLKWIEYVASDEYRTDGRNHASNKIARELIDAWQQIQPGNITPSNHLPLI